MLKFMMTVLLITGGLSAAPSKPQAGSTDSAKICSTGLAYHRLYNPDSTVKYLSRSAQSAFVNDTVLICLAEAKLWKKEFEDARALLARVANKKLPGYQRVAALYLEMVGQLKEAAALYDSLILIEQKPWNSLMRKAQVLSWMKRFDESIVIFSRVALSDSAPLPVRLSAVIRRAEVKAWQHQFPSAFHELDSLIHLLAKVKDPASRDRIVEALQLKGQVLEWDGRFQEAKNTYKDILLKDPSNKRAKLILEKLLWVK